MIPSEAITNLTSALTESLSLIKTQLNQSEPLPGVETKVDDLGSQISKNLQTIAEAKAPDRLTANAITNTFETFTQEVKDLMELATKMQPVSDQPPTEKPKPETAPVNVVTNTGAATTY